MNFRQRVATGVIPLAFVGGTMAFAPAALAQPAPAAVAHSAPAAVRPATTYTCHFTLKDNLWYAGYYSGDTVTPSATSVTASGKEAQCILKSEGYPVGTVDGEFGSNSQKAMKDFQSDVNAHYGKKVLTVDGWPGPDSWPYLRTNW